LGVGVAVDDMVANSGSAANYKANCGISAPDTICSWPF